MEEVKLLNDGEHCIMLYINPLNTNVAELVISNGFQNIEISIFNSEAKEIVKGLKKFINYDK